MDLACSLKDCAKPIVGVGVVLADEDEQGWETEDVEFYNGLTDQGRETHFALVHPTCFIAIFEELLRQENETTFFVAISKTGNLREALEIPT